MSSFIPSGVDHTMQPSGAGPTDPQQPAQQGQAPAIISARSGAPFQWNDAQLLDMFKRWKKESFDQRWIFERQWMRNVWYILNRQWIYFDSRRGQWQDKRLAKWVPRPVTNILKTGVQSVRANFASINYGANARPLGEDNLSIITAAVADDYVPILHEDHRMDTVMNEFDFWMLVTGNAFLHTAVSRDLKNGQTDVKFEQCQNCGQEYSEVDIAQAKQKCPGCQMPAKATMQPAIDPETGRQKVQTQNLAKGITTALSPFEIAFPIMYSEFDDLPYVIKMRWRDKTYFEQTPELAQTYANTLAFTKVPQERTMQIFKTLPFQGDLGISPPFFASGGANVDSEGLVEYEVWVKPCKDFPEGAVIRIWGDQNPTIAHQEQDEALPGPIPYHDAKGNPLFTFHMARYEHVGGRIYGSAMIDPAIQKQDQLNQLDSHMLMVIGRMANPIWLEPKGAEVEKFTGEPGLVVKWNPLVAGGNAKPERIPGEGINQSVFAYREMIKNEAQELMGTFDIMQGQKPAGADAYATVSFLYERATGRHASAYKERGAAYKGWCGDALSIEQEFGEETRIRAMMQPTKGWAFQTFQKADLKGNVEIIIEDGTLAPKTSLGERSTIDHLAQLGMINPNDPEIAIEVFRKFGQSSLMPSVDAQVQEAWRNMDRFEKFLGDPMAIKAAQLQAQQEQAQAAMTGQPAPPVGPLIYRRWYNAQIHRNELINWMLSDRGRAVMYDDQGNPKPAVLQMLDAYLTQIDMAIAQAQMGILDAGGVMIDTQPQQPPPAGPGGPPQQQGRFGRAQQMSNSNQNAGGAGDTSSGSAGTSSPSKLPPQNAVSIAQRARAAHYLDQANQPGA